MNFKGETLDNLHIGDVNITEDLQVDGNHVVAGNIEVQNIQVENINPLPPATDIKINSDLDTQNNKLLSSTNPTGVIIQGADFEASSNINRVVDIDLRGNLTNLDTGFPQLLNPTLAGSTLYGGADIKTAQLSYVVGTGDISVIDNLNLNDNRILNVTELTSTTEINMPQTLTMAGNSIRGVSEVRGFDSNPLLLNTFNDGSGIEIEEFGDVKLQKDINMDSKLIKNVFSISNDNDGEVLIQGSNGVDALLVGDNNITSSAPVTINTNTKTSIIDNEFNTFDSSSANIFNVNTGGTHDFTINNQQKLTVGPLITESRLPIKIINQPLQFDLSANIETTNTSDLSIDLEGENLTIRADPITDDALEYETTLGNFSFNKNVNLQTAKINNATNITFPLSMTPNGAFQVLGGVYIVKDLQCNGQIYCDTINNIRPSGGVYSESDGYTLAGDGGTLERPILNQGTSYGSLMVPANSFTPGDCFSFKCGGQITCNNNATFTLRLCSNFTAGGGGLNESDFASINVEVDGAQSADFWEIEVEFICRSVGGAGVASISTNGHYSYFSSTDFQKGYGINNTNSTTFNTTVSNDLQIGFFSNESAAALSSFQVDQVSLTKLY